MTIISILIFSISFFLVTGTGYQIPIYKELAGLSICGSIIIFWIWKYNKYLALLIAWCFARNFLPDYNDRGILSIFNVFMAGVLYLGVANLKIDKIKLLQAICVISFVHIIVGFLQKFNLFLFWNYADMFSYGRTWGLFGNGNYSGCFIAITLPIYLEMARTNKVYYWGLLGIPVLFIIDSQTPIVAGIAGLLIYFYFKHRDAKFMRQANIGILACTVLMMFWLILHPIYLTSDIERWETWRRIIRFMLFPGTHDWQSHFVQGYGMGSAYLLLPKLGYTSTNTLWYQAHNEILQIWLECGIVGVILSCLLVWDIFKRTTSRLAVYYACLVAVLIESLGFFIFHTAPMGHMAVIYLALIDKEKHA